MFIFQLQPTQMKSTKRKVNEDKSEVGFARPDMLMSLLYSNNYNAWVHGNYSLQWLLIMKFYLWKELKGEGRHMLMFYSSLASALPSNF